MSSIPDEVNVIFWPCPHLSQLLNPDGSLHIIHKHKTITNSKTGKRIDFLLCGECDFCLECFDVVKNPHIGHNDV